MIRFFRHRAARILAGIIGIEALVVMAGWILGIDLLTRIAPFGINMKFVTAFLFLFGALELYFVSRAVQDEDDVALVLLPGISLAISLVTIALLVGRLFGTSTGIENLFVENLDPANFSGTALTGGWPSFPTLINFILLGLAGLASLFPGFFREKLLIYLGCFISLSGLIAIVGYLCNVPVLYYELSISTIPMALNTALCFALLGFGLTQINRPERKQ